MRHSVDSEVQRLALRQLGLFTRAQAVGAGADHNVVARRKAAGSWIEVLPGIYRLSAYPRSWEQTLFEGVLYIGRGAVVSHLAAAALYGFDGVPPRPDPHISVPTRCQKRLPPTHTLHVASDLLRSDRAKIGPIPLTVPARTVVDLAGVIEDADTLELIYESARTKGFLDDDRLVRRLASISRRGKPGVARLRALLQRRDAEVKDSTMETLFCQLIRDLGLPDPVLHFAIHDEQGNFIAEVDAGYPHLSLFWELDSWRHHGQRRRFRIDRHKRNRIIDLGHTLYWLTWQDLTLDRAREGRRIVEAYQRAAGAVRDE